MINNRNVDIGRIKNIYIIILILKGLVKVNILFLFGFGCLIKMVVVL